MNNSTSKLGPRKRILKKAAELFYLRGFSNTHVGDIIEESKSYKKSFYQYFRDKNHLAEEYLNLQEQRILKNTIKLTKKYPDYSEFIKHWMLLNRKFFQGPRFAGCPFANFAIQTLNSRALFQSRIHQFLDTWEEILRRYLETLQDSGRLPKELDAQKLARKMILLYEGGIQSYLMSRDLSYLDLVEEEMLRIVKII
jgi:AcrR family transcriptional regulator